MDENLALLDKIERYAWEALGSLALPDNAAPMLRFLDIVTRCRTMRMSIEIEQRRRADVDGERG